MDPKIDEVSVNRAVRRIEFERQKESLEEHCKRAVLHRVAGISAFGSVPIGAEQAATFLVSAVRFIFCIDHVHFSCTVIATRPNSGGQVSCCDVGET